MLWTREDLKTYIKNMLGEGLINVEVTDYQINECINFAISKYSEIGFFGRDMDIIVISLPKNFEQKSYPIIKLDSRVMEVIALRKSGGGGFGGLGVGGGLIADPSELIAQITGGIVVGGALGNSGGSGSPLLQVTQMLAKVSAYQSMFEVVPNFEFNGYTKELKIFDNLAVGTKLILEVCLEYKPDEKGDGIFQQQWVKEYALQRTKLTWGQNLGKFDTSLVQGAKVNYERIIGEAKEALEKLEEELHSVWSPIFYATRG